MYKFLQQLFCIHDYRILRDARMCNDAQFATICLKCGKKTTIGIR
jgi:hypothetical protein